MSGISSSQPIGVLQQATAIQQQQQQQPSTSSMQQNLQISQQVQQPQVRIFIIWSLYTCTGKHPFNNDACNTDDDRIQQI